MRYWEKLAKRENKRMRKAEKRLRKRRFGMLPRYQEDGPAPEQEEWTEERDLRDDSYHWDWDA